jgi:peptide deformylase
MFIESTALTIPTLTENEVPEVEASAEDKIEIEIVDDRPEEDQRNAQPLPEEIVKDTEGCLSFPAFFLSIPRPKWIEVEFTDENGQRKQTRLDGLTARCFLHELEHLNGVKFTSHVGSVAMLQAKRKQEKLIKKIVRRKK